jgi:hypothetical protein
MAAGWVAALRRGSPYLATFLIVTVLLMVGFLRAHGPDPSRRAEIVPPGASSPAPSTGASRSPGRTVSPRPVDPTSSAPTPTAGRRGPRIVAWIRDLGLTGGAGSYQEAFVAELSWGQCAELRRDVDAAPKDEVDETTRGLYRAAAQACLAAFHGKRSLWSAADAAVEELSGRSATLNCIDRSVYDLTRALVKIHRSDPGVVLQRGHADDADGPDCPRLRSIEPSSGPATGGYQVRITGEHLPDPAIIHFGEVTRTVPTSGGRTALLTVPPVGQYHSVSVWVEGWPFEVLDSPDFTYDPPPSTAEQSHGP